MFVDNDWSLRKSCEQKEHVCLVVYTRFQALTNVCSSSRDARIVPFSSGLVHLGHDYRCLHFNIVNVVPITMIPEAL